MFVLDPSALAALLRHPEIASAIRDAVGTASADEHLTLDEAGEIAKCEARKIRDAGRAGDVVLGSAGGEPRITRRELERWLSTAPRKKPRKTHARRLSEPEAIAANDTTDPRAAARAAVARAAAKIASTK